MYEIAKEFIQEWIETDEGIFPGSVETICPFCGLSTTFDPLLWQGVPEVRVRVTTTRCEACGEAPAFFWVADQVTAKSHAGQQHSLFMNPAPRSSRHPVEGISESREFDVALKRAYASAINMYNAREWTGTLVICRRALEDIAKALLPSDLQKLNLSKQIEALRKSKDLSEPVAVLAHGLRRSGSLGAYFDLEKEPDEEVATLVLDLLDYLITYLFALPARIQVLNRCIESLPEEAPRPPAPLRSVKAV